MEFCLDQTHYQGHSQQLLAHAKVDDSGIVEGLADSHKQSKDTAVRRMYSVDPRKRKAKS